MAADHEPGLAILREVALRLDYMVGQITPEEFRWQDANYDRDSALGRELLFLIANSDWTRATSETIDVTRCDTVETTIKIDVDLDRVTHEAFRGRTGLLWLPVLVLPPARRPVLEPGLPDQPRIPDPDPFATLTVTDAGGTPLAILPNADVRHRIAAALTEIIVNIAVTRLPDGTGDNSGATRDQRLLLAAALYRLLRNEHVPGRVLDRTAPAREPSDEPSRICHAERGLGELLKYYSDLLETRQPADDGEAPGARLLTVRAITVLRAFAECSVVVAAVELGHTPVVLTVRVPSRALRQAPPGASDTQPAATPRWRHPSSWRWLHPSTWNWILPRACLRIGLLLPFADADRQVQVNLPDGVAFDPSVAAPTRARLDIRAERPMMTGQLAELMSQLTDPAADWSPELYRCIGDLASAKASAVRESLRDHRVGPAPGQPVMAPADSTLATRAFGDRLDELCAVLRGISARHDIGTSRTELAALWGDGGAWLQVPMQRRTSTDTVSPDFVVTRARMIEDPSQRTVPAEARIQVRIAVTDSEHFSIASLTGWMSILLMLVVLSFFAAAQLALFHDQDVSAEVLAFVLTLFSAIQAGRIERSDQSTMRGLLAQAGNGLIVASVLPTVILAVALAFSRNGGWALTFAAITITLQLLMQILIRQRLKRYLAQAQHPADGVRQRGLVLFTDLPDYSHTEILHSPWWRRTTADALLMDRQAHGYLIWQHGAPRTPHTLRSLLQAGRPASELPDPSPVEPPQDEPDEAAGPRSLLEQPANVLALQRSGTGAQSLTFAVFRDEPETGWDQALDDVVTVDLRPGRPVPVGEVTSVTDVFLGLRRGEGLIAVPQHPVTAVLAAAHACRLTVLEIQLPVPAPAAAYSDLQWARVRLGLRDHDTGRLLQFLRPIHSLATAGGSQAADAVSSVGQPVVGVQTVSEGIPRILNPRPMHANPGPAAEAGRGHRARPVLARDLDVVAASGVSQEEPATAKTWRVMAVCGDWRGGVDYTIFQSIDPRLRLAGMTYAVLHGEAVLLLLGHHPGHPPGHDDPRLGRPGDGDASGLTVYLDQWQSRGQLGEAEEYPLFRVHMRTPDRPGATLDMLASLGKAFEEMTQGALKARDWNVWYARSVVAAGNIARIELTARLSADPARTHFDGKPVSQWGPAEFSKIERRTLTLAARRMSVSGDASPDPGLDIPEDTVISVGPVQTPDLDAPGEAPPGASPPGSAGCAADHGDRLGQERVGS